MVAVDKIFLQNKLQQVKELRVEVVEASHIDIHKYSEALRLEMPVARKWAYCIFTIFGGERFGNGEIGEGRRCHNVP